MCLHIYHTPTSGLLGRPTACICEKGGRSMFDARTRLDVRPEVQNCIRSCEYLLSTAAASAHPPFSEDEQQLLAYYAAELAQMVDRSVQGSATNTDPETVRPPLRSVPAGV